MTDAPEHEQRRLVRRWLDACVGSCFEALNAEDGTLANEWRTSRAQPLVDAWKREERQRIVDALLVRFSATVGDPASKAGGEARGPAFFARQVWNLLVQEFSARDIFRARPVYWLFAADVPLTTFPPAPYMGGWIKDEIRAWWHGRRPLSSRKMGQKPGGAAAPSAPVTPGRHRDHQLFPLWLQESYPALVLDTFVEEAYGELLARLQARLVRCERALFGFLRTVIILWCHDHTRTVLPRAVAARPPSSPDLSPQTKPPFVRAEIEIETEFLENLAAPGQAPEAKDLWNRAVARAVEREPAPRLQILFARKKLEEEWTIQDFRNAFPGLKDGNIHVLTHRGRLRLLASLLVLDPPRRTHLRTLSTATLREMMRLDSEVAAILPPDVRRRIDDEAVRDDSEAVE